MMKVDLSDVPALSVPDRTVFLRDITATEELEAHSAEALLRALVVEGGTAALPDLTLSEQDMAVAALYRTLYGETIECHVPCRACDRMFETQFEISDWIAALRQGLFVVRVGVNAYETTGGLRFRLPTSADLADLPDEDPEAALRAKCLLEGDPVDPLLEPAMACAGPLLDDEIDATCPHCGAERSFAVRMDSYLLAALARERPMVVREIHHIASRYQWSRAEIMALPRNVRRDHVRLILADYSKPSVAAWR